MKPVTTIAKSLQQNPVANAKEAVDYLISQGLEITKLRYTLSQIGYGDDPLTVMRSMARQALSKK